MENFIFVQCVFLIVIITNTEAGEHDAAKQLGERNKGVRYKNCAQLTKCIREINYSQIDHAKYVDFVMSMYKLIKYQQVCSNITKIIEMII